MTTTGGKRRAPRPGQPHPGPAKSTPAKSPGAKDHSANDRARDRGASGRAKDRAAKDRGANDRGANDRAKDRNASDRNARPSNTGPPGVSRPKVARLKQARRQARRRRGVIWAVGAVVLAGVITAMVLTVGSHSGSTQSSMARHAPAFALKDTTGKTVSLAGYRGRDVVLYFNEGVGCGACFYQMRDFEQHASALTKAGLTILPIVMNPASQVRQELASYGLHTPFLIDASGSVSRAYGTLGKGMHAGLPGHGFILIDGNGTERWYGEYPSMYLSTAGLLRQVRAHLAS